MLKKLKLCIAAVKIICHNAFLSLFRVPSAALYCKLILRNRQTHYVVICDHIGDFLITMGYLASYKHQYHYEHITVCVAAKFQKLLEAYPSSYDHYLLLPSVKLYKLLTIGATNFGFHVLKKLGNITLVNPADAFIEDDFQYIMHYPTVTLKDCIQYGCLHLASNALFDPPCFHKKVIKKEIPGFREGRTVLLSPFARSISIEENMKIFIALAKLLKELEFSVLTNISDAGHQPIPGTQGIVCPLDQIISLVQSGGYIVGVRNGLLDLLAYTKCTIIAIYPNIPGYKGFFNLNHLPKTQAKIFQVSLTMSVSHDIEQILKFLQGGEPWQ